MTQYTPGQLDLVFDDIESGQAVTTFAPRLPEGTHDLVLTYYGAKRSAQQLGTILEAEFLIENSSTATVGATFGWPWFPGRSGWAGAFEKQRVKDFMSAFDTGLGKGIRPTKETGADLASYAFRGARVRCVVTKSIDNKTGQVRMNRKGQPMFDATFSAVRQTPEQMAEYAAMLGPIPVRAQDNRAMASAPVAQPAPAYVAPVAPPAPVPSVVPSSAPSSPGLASILKGFQNR